MNSFRTLKAALVSPPVLRLPRSGLPFSVVTDSSEYQIGCVLLQTHEDGQKYPLGYWSRALSGPERNYSVTEKECLAIVWSIQMLPPYLQGNHFTLFTYHEPIRWLLNLTDVSGRLFRWRLRLAEFDFEVKYERGNNNHLADTLSRLSTTNVEKTNIDDEIPCFSGTATMYDGTEEDPVDVILTTEADAKNLKPLELLTPITREEILNEQANDKLCRVIKKRIENGEDKCAYKFDDDGIIVRRAYMDS